MMDATLIRFYLHENQRHHGTLLWEWLLDQANRMGLKGGTAFRAIGGFGRHHVVQEDRFFELAGSLPIAVEFVVAAGEMARLMALLHHEGLHLPFVSTAATIGVTSDAGPPP